MTALHPDERQAKSDIDERLLKAVESIRFWVQLWSLLAVAAAIYVFWTQT